MTIMREAIIHIFTKVLSWKHILLCLLITLAVGQAAHFIDRDILWGLAAGMAAGIGKELYDKLVKKTLFDILDLAADAAGSILGVFILALFNSN